MAPDLITFTTDYGLADGFVGVCEGVVSRIAPGVRVVHITHLVPPQDVRRGAAVLAQSVPYFPRAVHMAVVDPGVGTRRRAVAVETANGVLVGPDNGLLVPAAEALGGAVAVHELTELLLEPVSATFHGRDVFAPAAAHIAAGRALAELGAAVRPADLVRLPAPVTSASPGRVRTEVLGTDSFGNVQFAAVAADLEAAEAAPGSAVHVEVGGRSLAAVVAHTFGDVPAGRAVLYIDSAGRAAVAVNGGAASRTLTSNPGDPVVILVER